MKYVIEIVMKMYLEIPYFIKISQKYWTLHKFHCYQQH